MDLEAVTGELYGLAPGEFTARRDALVAEARKSGDRELAGLIKQLRRPTVSAWLSNLLARERADQLDSLLEMGQALRDAQAQLAGDDLRRLSAQRHRVVAALGQEARRLAGDQVVGEAAARELEGTLDAALADPRAGEAVRAGRLTGALSYSGLGEVDLSQSVSLPAARASAPARASASATTDARAARREAEERRRRERIEEAERAVADARRATEYAQQEVAGTEDALEEARRQEESAQTAVQEAEQAVERARAAAAQAATGTREARRVHERAVRKRDAAHRREAQAAEHRRALDEPG